VSCQPSEDRSARFDVVEATIPELQQELAEGRITSRELVEAYLVRIAILDRFDAELFEAVTGCVDAQAQLDLLVRETPIMVADERVQWFRLHLLARDFLLSRFEQLPRLEQAGLHARASRCFAANERFHEAALHALAAGDVALAQNYAARSLWSLSTSGKQAEAREWLDRLPREMFAKDSGLRLVAASILAFSDRNAEALSIANDVLRESDTPPQSRVVALRIAAGAAAFADRLGLIPELIPHWPGLDDPGGAPLYTMACLNARAVVALHAGDTAQVRELIAQQAVHGSAGELRMAAALGRMLVGLSYLWDGDPIEAEAAVRPSLAEAEAENRRGMIACLHASVVAAALLERDQLAAAQAMLANRLDVVERSGFPDIILCAYRTLARIALVQGDQRRALGVLDSLDALGRRRELPRLRLYSLAERVRIHAMHGRTDTVAKLVREIDELAAEFEHEATLPLQPEYRLVAALATVHAALARDDLDTADRHLETADALAAALHRRLDELRVKVLRAVTARRRGDSSALPLLREAIGLAALAGQVRILTDIHPLATQMMDGLQTMADAPQPPATRFHAPHARPSAQVELLTSKEAEILDMLDKGMPNKLIARNLEISGETVKWHLKNVYLKLSVGSRRHAVERARVLGLMH
jgi:LuxR family maltose regulon positive regulatory protein